MVVVAPPLMVKSIAARVPTFSYLGLAVPAKLRTLSS
jgi:hypothetical protein